MNISKKPGMYIHIPFCDTKCGYCDFYSIINHSARGEFLEALLKEIRHYATTPFKDEPFDTIYFGVGTPSLLSEKEFEAIFAEIHKNFPIASNCETTIEANPGTMTEEKLRFYRSLGINRLSIGIQSFNDDELKVLGRIHDSKQAIKTVSDARKNGFDNISIDLIFATPNQSLDDWLYSLNTGLSLQTEHVSAYNLIYEEGTPFYKKLMSGKLVEKSEEEAETFYTKTKIGRAHV